jgi:hypothetical protein
LESRTCEEYLRKNAEITLADNFEPAWNQQYPRNFSVEIQKLPLQIISK